jgi:hypothetical protein
LDIEKRNIQQREDRLKEKIKEKYERLLIDQKKELESQNEIGTSK